MTPSWTMRLPDKSSGSHLAALLLPQANESGLIIPHDDARIRTTHEVAPVGRIELEALARRFDDTVRLYSTHAGSPVEQRSRDRCTAETSPTRGRKTRAKIRRPNVP